MRYGKIWTNAMRTTEKKYYREFDSGLGVMVLDNRRIRFTHALQVVIPIGGHWSKENSCKQDRRELTAIGVDAGNPRV
jgi:hypothetical protein